LVTNNGSAAYDGTISEHRSEALTVGLDALRARVDEYGPAAYLVTVGDDGRPHIVSVRTAWEDDRLVAGAGRTTAKNAGSRPGVSLLWPRPIAGYSLIVDGAAAIRGEGVEAAVTIEPARAVLHRVVDADGEGPSCVTVL
jgi:hypothetical protein